MASLIKILDLRDIQEVVKVPKSGAVVCVRAQNGTQCKQHEIPQESLLVLSTSQRSHAFVPLPLEILHKRLTDLLKILILLNTSSEHHLQFPARHTQDMANELLWRTQ